MSAPITADILTAEARNLDYANRLEAAKKTVAIATDNAAGKFKDGRGMMDRCEAEGVSIDDVILANELLAEHDAELATLTLARCQNHTLAQLREYAGQLRLRRSRAQLVALKPKLQREFEQAQAALQKLNAERDAFLRDWEARQNPVAEQYGHARAAMDQADHSAAWLRQTCIPPEMKALNDFHGARLREVGEKIAEITERLDSSRGDIRATYIRLQQEANKAADHCKMVSKSLGADDQQKAAAKKAATDAAAAVKKFEREVRQPLIDQLAELNNQREAIDQRLAEVFAKMLEL